MHFYRRDFNKNTWHDYTVMGAEAEAFVPSSASAPAWAEARCTSLSSSSAAAAESAPMPAAMPCAAWPTCGAARAAADCDPCRQAEVRQSQPEEAF
jgi:hypothetical protein